MPSLTLLHAAVTIGFGAIAGGVTNAIAIWMLFHPHERRGVGGLGIQGAIPKNRARLAKTIGRTVGERLLTPEDLAAQLRSPGVREAFAEVVTRLVRDLLETERGSLRQELPGPVAEELDGLLAGLGEGLADRVAEFVSSPGFQPAAERFVRDAAATFADRPLGDVLTEARRQVIRTRVEEWVAQAVASPDLERTIRDWLDRQLVRAAGDATPLMERLPAGLIAAVERAISGYLPVAIDRLGGLLQDPETRARLERTLHAVVKRFVDDLMLHERIVARIVVNERTITKLLDNVGRDGSREVGALLDEPDVQQQIATQIGDAVLAFLRKPVAEHLSALGQERIEGLRDSATRAVVAGLRDPGTRAYAIERLDRALAGAERRTWGELLDKLPPAQAAGWLADALRTAQARRWILDAWRAAAGALLDRPIGRPAALLGDGAADRLATRLRPVLWDWVERQVPDLVGRLDIQGMVEQKVLGFSLTRIEEIVRMTTQRELDLIVRLGFLLGGLVGLVAFAVQLLLP